MISNKLVEDAMRHRKTIAMEKLTGIRKLYCPKCRVETDRDANAAKNIILRGMRFVPIVLPTEAMVQASSEAQEDILKVDGSEVSELQRPEP